MTKTSCYLEINSSSFLITFLDFVAFEAAAPSFEFFKTRHRIILPTRGFIFV